MGTDEGAGRGLRIATIMRRNDGMLRDLRTHARRRLILVPACRIAAFDSRTGLSRARQWRPHGIIAHINRRDFAEELLAFGVPVVNTSGILDALPFPSVVPDNHRAGRLAAEHLLSKGFRRFGFVGPLDHGYARDRLEGFRQVIEESGSEEVRVYDVSPPAGAESGPLLAWLRGLPEGAAVFTADDRVGGDLMEKLRLADPPVPRPAGIISGHDRNTPTNPLLTAVRLPEQRWGYEAAGLLIDMVRRGTRQAEDVRLPPLGVIERESTARLATDDPCVTAAVRFIHDHAAEAVTVHDVAHAARVSRRTLERRFYKALGRTMLHEIHRAHAEHAKALLIDTDLPLQAVAVESGLTDEKHLRRVFAQHVGMTPSVFRRQHRIT